MKTLLIVESSIYGGGSFISLQKMIKKIDERKYRIIVLTFTDYEEKLKKISVIDNIYTIKKESGLVKCFFINLINKCILKGFFKYGAVKVFNKINHKAIDEVKDIIVGESIDIVVTNTEPFRDLVGILAADELRKPLISLIRSKYQVKAISPPRKLIEKIDGAVDLYLTVSEDTSRSWVDMFHISKSKTYCIYDYAEQANVSNNIRVRHKSSNVRLVCVANILPVKNYEFLLSSTEKFLANNPESTLTIVGSGDPYYFEKIKKVAYKNPSMKKQIFFKGYVDNTSEIIASSDFLLLFSHREGFPNVILESMREGALVIATNVGGISEAIQNNISGMLIEPGDGQSVYQVLTDLSNNDRKYNEITENARKRLNEKFSSDEYSSVINKMFDSIGLTQ